MPTPTLKEELKDWSDFDAALHSIAISLGMFENQKTEVGWFAVKPTYWSANPVSDSLSAILRSLTELGVLEHDGQEDKWRWNPAFLMVPEGNG